MTGPLDVLRFERDWMAYRLDAAYRGAPLDDCLGRFNDALAQVAALVDADRRVMDAWERLGECEDEFGIRSEFCAEHMDALDSAVADLPPFLARLRALEARADKDGQT